MKKKQLLIGGGIAVILLLLFGVWNLWFSATKVAFINYQVISLGQISKANDNSFIKISELSTDDLNRLAGYDMVFILSLIHISEPTRRTPISYAVFCLKKKKCPQHAPALWLNLVLLSR